MGSALTVHKTGLTHRTAQPPRLDRRACRLLLVFLLIVTFAGQWIYLTCSSSVDLAEDEAYYWDWSRQLDVSFYSKGPVVPLLIRGSCELLGQTMPAVRLPALLLRAGVTLFVFWLARRLFHSERIALGAACLSYVIPMLTATGLVITADAPLVFFWTLACCFAALALFDHRPWAWWAIGAAIGAGTLAKFVMPLWLIGLAAFLLLDPLSRYLWRTRRPWVILIAALPFATPVLWWNAQHHWATFRHVSQDIGGGRGNLVLNNIADVWLGQMGVAGPLMFLIFLAAIIFALRRPVRQAGRRIADHPERRSMLFLLCMSLPVFVGVLMVSFRKHAGANWCAPMYAPLVILTAYFLARKAADHAAWRRWRLLFYPALLLNIVLVIFAHVPHVLYPAVALFNAHYPEHARTLKQVDPTYRLHGWREVGQAVGEYRDQLDPDAIIMAADYQTTAILAFYVPQQPRTYCVGAYFLGPTAREAFSQYDFWPDRRLDREHAANTSLLGRNAIYIGPMTTDMRCAFRTITPLPDIVVRRHGMELRRLQAWACTSFQGMIWPGWNGAYDKH